MRPLRKLTDIPIDSLRGKRVLVRSDFNVPLGDNNQIDQEEAWRIEKGLRTLRYLGDNGARVVVVSHLGRKGESLLPVAEYINQVSDFDLGFVPELVGERVYDMVSEMPHGATVMLENLRQHPGEKAGEDSFAEELSTYADMYVNDAFSASHRDHASIAKLSKLIPAYAGLQFIDEYEYLSKARQPDSPAMLILGGAKFGTKLSLLRSYLAKADKVFVGGALANNFFLAKGYPVGRSLVDEGANISDLISNEKIITPIDVTVQDSDGVVRIANPKLGDIKESETITDCGPATLELLKREIENMESVTWNGPLGNYEIGFSENTKELARILARSKAEVYVGGGDTVTVIRTEGLIGQYAFVSTAGGAMLDFLVDGEMAGLEALLI